MRRFLAPPPRSYEGSIHIVLSFIRFVGFALAVALTFIIPKSLLSDWQTILIVGLVGVYTALKVLFRFHLWKRDFLLRIILGADLAVCLALVLLTGGIDSPFLLYAILPTVTAAFYFELRLSLLSATLTSLGVILAHTVLTGVGRNFAPIQEGNYLSFVLIYVLFCFVIAVVPYQANLNVYRYVEANAMVGERKRLRQEIHDGIAQVLGYLSTRTKLLKESLRPSDKEILAELEEIIKATSQSYEEIREAIDSLGAETEGVPLTTVLSRHIERLGRSTGIKTEFTAPPDLPALPLAVSLQLLRITQEALNNVRKHAAATQVWVTIETTPSGVELVVKDNGRGFLMPAPAGIGLKIMEERAKSAGGTLTITSSPGEGTMVKVLAPRR